MSEIVFSRISSVWNVWLIYTLRRFCTEIAVTAFGQLFPGENKAIIFRDERVIFFGMFFSFTSEEM